jgi:hypothetical protein
MGIFLLVRSGNASVRFNINKSGCVLVIMAMCFRTWLSEKLFNLNNDVDLEVFVSYITGILEADSAIDDKKDSLGDIIAEILVSARAMQGYLLTPVDVPMFKFCVLREYTDLGSVS